MIDVNKKRPKWYNTPMKELQEELRHTESEIRLFTFQIRNRQRWARELRRRIAVRKKLDVRGKPRKLAR